MKIVAAVIGTGIGEKHLEAIDGFIGSKVKIICEKNQKKIKILKKKYPDKIVTSNEEVIFNDKQINLVSLASYDNYHYSQILKCFKYNKNIIVEKPMCLTLEELKKIKSISKKSKVKIISNLVLRENELFKDFKKKINKKKIYYIEAAYIWGRPKKLFEWRSKIKNYSIILGAAIHMVDLIMWFLEDKPKYVTSFGTDKFTQGTSFTKKNCVTLIIEFSSGIIAKINANSLAVHPHFHELKIFQKNKTLVHNLSGSYEHNNRKLIYNNKKYPDKKNRKNLIRKFINNLKNNLNNNYMPLKEQFDLMSVCFAAEKSLIRNKKIKINYL